MSEGINITRAEESLFGSGQSAVMVRRLGMAEHNAQEARAAAQRMVEGSRDSDSFSSTATGAKIVAEPSGPREYDERGNSEHTLWLETVFERCVKLEQLAGEVYRELSIEAAQREHKFRQGIDSLPPVPHPV